ncbi:type II toxin-antitoxin system Phd/YefM family antitoxin [Geminicoccus harenae]|uniref:type II toxin-antitoxin system Phd/YefM family antitoxin n=1 Tax=Geminicoccus harenae TaxID=2498453 RepID=UPI00168B3D66|nr:type II toxin-antitoxin system prevent-host-death family antitoxin [Geminicoccus harenae]
MAYVTFTDLRNNLASYLDKVEDDRRELIVTRKNHDPVVILSLSEWESMKETLHLLSTPENARRLRAAVDELNAGKGSEHDLVEP